jgi:hypothetical protein
LLALLFRAALSYQSSLALKEVIPLAIFMIHDQHFLSESSLLLTEALLTSYTLWGFLVVSYHLSFQVAA